MGPGEGAQGGTATGAIGKHPNCDGCNSPITSKTVLITTVCKHNFHKDCLQQLIKLRPFCPVCNARIFSEGPVKSTRAQNKDPNTEETNASQIPGSTVSNVAARDPSPTVPVAPAAVSADSLRDMISTIVSAQNAQLLATLNSHISALVEQNVRSSLSGLSVPASPPASTVKSQVLPQGD